MSFSSTEFFNAYFLLRICMGIRVEHGLWSGIPDSLICIPHSKEQDS